MKALSQSEYGELRNLYESIYTPKVDLSEELFDEIFDELVDEYIEEGYSEEDAIEIVDEAIDIYIDEVLCEASDSYYDSAVRASKKAAQGIDKAARQKRRAGQARYYKRKAGEALKAAGDKAKGAVAGAKKKASAAKTGVEIAGVIAKDEAKRAGRKAVHAATTAPGKAKKGLKGFIKRQAQKVVDRMSEEAIQEADSIAAMRERAAKRRKQRYGASDTSRGGRDDFRPYTKADYERGEANDPRKKVKEELEAIGEDSRRMSNKQHTKRVRSNIKSFGSNYTPPSNYDPDANRGQGEVLTRKQIEKKRRKSLRQEEFDAFDVVLEFLQVEGYAETLEEAEWMMANLIDEEAIDIISEADSLAAMRERAAKRRKQRYGASDTSMGGRDDFRPYTKDDYKNPKPGYGSSTKKEEFEAWLDEAMSSYDRNRKRAAQRAAARNAARDAGKTGAVPGVGYVTPRRERETYVDSAGTTRHKSGAKMEEFEAVDEAMSSYDRNRKRAAQRAAARNAARDQGKTGAVPGVGYVTPRRERETWTDESGKTRHAKGL